MRHCRSTTVTCFLYGHILIELQEVVADPEEADDLLRLGLYRLPAREFPQVRSLTTGWTTWSWRR